MGRKRWAPTPGRRRSGYRGADRREQVVTGAGATGGPWVAAGLTLGALIVASVVFVLVRRLGPMPDGLVVGFRSGAVALAAVLAVVARLHWRATGGALACRLSTAAWLLVGGGIVGQVMDSPLAGPRLGWLGLTITITAAAWLTWGLLGPEVDTDTRPDMELLGAVAVTALGWGLMHLLAPVTGATPSPRVFAVAALVAGLIWIVVAGIALVRAVARASAMRGWVTWLAVGLSVAELARFAARVHSPEWLDLTAGARAWGLMIATVGLASSLSRSAIDRRHQLHAATVHERAEEHAAHGRDRERAHEIRNALFAVEGATQALERYGDRLSASDRADLSAAVSRGIDHLRNLLEPHPEARSSLAVRDLVASRAALVRARGVTVRVEGNEAAHALADEVMCAQVIDNLLVNAVRHGDAATKGVQVRIEQDAAWIRVVVRDAGSGVPLEDSERIFEAGVRLHTDRDGEGLGLALARALAQRQGGDLLLEPSDERRGARFVLSLPRAGRVGGSGETVQGLEDLSEGVEASSSGATADSEGATPAGGRLVIEHDDGLSIHIEDSGSDDRDVESIRGRAGQQRDVDAGGDQ